MQKMIYWAIMMIVFTVGAYHLAVVGLGASDTGVGDVSLWIKTGFATVAATFVFVVSAAFATATTFAVLTLTIALAAATAFSTTTYSALASFATTTTFAAATTFSALAFIVVADDEMVSRRWAVGAVGIESATIFGALTIGIMGWSVAIALAGVTLLIILCILAPEPIVLDRAE